MLPTENPIELKKVKASNKNVKQEHHSFLSGIR
jgi:hypothetical protein